MLSHLPVYFAFTALHLFSGVSAAAIGLPSLDSRNLGSGTAVNKRDDGDDGPADPAEEIEDVLPNATKEQMTSLMAVIPDDVLHQGADATEDWIRNYIQPRPSPSIKARDADDADDDDDDDGSTELEERWLDDAWQITKCAGGIIWLVAQNITPAGKVLKAGKIAKLKGAIDDVGGYKAAAKSLMSKSSFHKGKHRKPDPNKKAANEKLAALAYEILGATVVVDQCPKIFD